VNYTYDIRNYLSYCYSVSWCGADCDYDCDRLALFNGREETN